MKHALDDIFPAAVLYIIYQGETVFEGSWGWIDPDARQLPVTPHSLFDLASVSKLFTTTAFLRLVSDGRVELDAPLVSVIPEFGEGGRRGIDGGQDPHTRAMLPPAPELRDQTVDPTEITFRHLLTHTSGLAPWRAVYLEAGPTPLPPDQTDPVDRHTRWKNGLRAIYHYPFVDLPGREIYYSDLGLILLGETVVRLFGAALDSAISALVLDPLNLKSILYNPMQRSIPREHIAPTENDGTWRERRCWGEAHDENTCGLGGVSGHAGLFGTAREVGLLGQAWLTQDPRLGISREIMDEATREQVSNDSERRGFGWKLWQPNPSIPETLSARTFGHTGFTGASLWVDPERGLVVSCLTNRVYRGREKEGIMPFRSALHALLGSYLH